MKIVKSVKVELSTENIKDAVAEWLDRNDELFILGPWLKNNIELSIGPDSYDRDLSDEKRIMVKATK
jgi:hypothetical protein